MKMKYLKENNNNGEEEKKLRTEIEFITSRTIESPPNQTKPKPMVTADDGMKTKKIPTTKVELKN